MFHDRHSRLERRDGTASNLHQNIFIVLENQAWHKALKHQVDRANSFLLNIKFEINLSIIPDKILIKNFSCWCIGLNRQCLAINLITRNGIILTWRVHKHVIQCIDTNKMFLFQTTAIWSISPNIVNSSWPIQQVPKNKGSSVQLTATFSHWAIDVKYWLTIWPICIIAWLSLWWSILCVWICLWDKVSVASWAPSSLSLISSSS